MLKSIFLTLSVLPVAAALAQGIHSAAPLEFEAADVHPSVKSVYSAPFMSGGDLQGTRLEIHRATMVDLIANAYSVDPANVLGGPSWLENERFDILAKAPQGTSPEDAKRMLQNLLAQRFHLVLHPDSRPKPAFVLSLGKGRPKVKEADPSGAPGCRGEQSRQESGVSNNVRVCHAQTMEQLVRLLPDLASAYLSDAPVLNRTGLEGAFDFTLEWTSRGQLQRAGPDAITIFQAIDKQLGLKLEQQRVLTAVLVVDSVNQKPAENPPGTEGKLPAPLPERFEVAVIKPTDPDFRDSRYDVSPGGRLDIAGETLSDMLQDIFFVNAEMIVGAPKFVDTDRWDITAKVSTDAAPGNTPNTDTDTVTLMMRHLLEDRFKLQAHFEEQSISGYVLTAAKPKLQKADPSGRTGCQEPAPGTAGAKDPRLAKPVLSRYLVCRNMTMAQFAEQLPYLASGYARTPVLDATGLTDAFDFTLSFSATRYLQNRRGPAQQGLASEPNGALSLPDAVAQQLGLKMTIQKHPAQVLVIDHIEQQPTAN